MSALVRYRVAPGRGEENAELVRAVYAELAATAPPGFRYATWALEDGESFLHLALGDGQALVDLAAFGAFRAGLGARCVEPVVLTPLATRIGGYGL